jgi:Core-2/I-Branching enzyme
MNFDKAFPLVFWINLGHREDRRFETEVRLNELGIMAERFAAVDSRFIRKTGEGDLDERGQKRGVRGYESAGRYALALTQRLAIREAARRNAPSVLLLEDDAVFHPNFHALTKAVELPEDWGIFYFGCTHNHPPEWAGSRVVRASWAVDTHAIAIHSRYYKEVMAVMDRHGKPDLGIARASDQFIATLHEIVPTYACYPNLIWQDVSGSDLLGARYSNYHADGLQKNWVHSVKHLLPDLIGDTDGPEQVDPKVLDFKTGNTTANDAVEVKSRRAGISRKEPKLGLLFLTRGDVHHPKIWDEFVSEAPERVKVFSHVKNPQFVSSALLKGTQIKERFKTEWGGIGLVKASRAMLLDALEDESLTHFVLLSESCVPIKPLPEILRRLELDPRPQFGCKTLKNANPLHQKRAKGITRLPEGCWRFQSQWWLMDRVTAVFSAGQDFTDVFEPMVIPDEAYFSTVLSMQGYPLEGSVFNKDVTWTWWERDAGSPASWDVMTEECLADMIHSDALFARKFPVGADIGKYGLHRTVGKGGVTGL